MLKDIIITDSIDEMIAIGKELIVKMPEVYTEKRIAALKNDLYAMLGDVTEEEKENKFYQAVYDFQAFGISVEEEVYLHLWNKKAVEKKEYITEGIRWKYMYSLNKKEDAHILNDKYEAFLTLTPYYKRDVIMISSEADYDKFCDFIKKHNEFVVKPHDSSCARGVRKACCADYESEKALFDELLADCGVFDKFSPAGQGKVVIEELIDQADELAAFHPTSVNALRVTTVRVGDKVTIFYPWIKIGNDGDFIASAAQGGFDAGIDAATGEIVTDGFMENGESIDVHPFSGVKFKGYKIPCWDGLVKTVTELAMSLDTIHYVGWDMVLTKNGEWCVMEGNFAGQFMGQMVHQRGFKAEFEELIGWNK